MGWLSETAAVFAAEDADGEWEGKLEVALVRLLYWGYGIIVGV